MSLNKFFIILLTLFSLTLVACNQSESGKQIGIIIPIEHQAMNEIVSGFTETLTQTYPGKVHFKIVNAQGDLNLLRSLTQQMRDKNLDLIVPIATAPTEMALSMITNTPLLSLAVVYSEENRKQRKVCNITAVHDEIPVAKSIDLIHTIYPTLSQLALIHSADDKIYSEVKTASDYAKKYHITITPYMVNTLGDLYSTANNISNQTQGFLILKDNLIASGASTLIRAANTRQIPFITSDQGTIQTGASFAIGVHEKEIGVQGAYLASKILKGENPCQIPLQDMKELTLFINTNAKTNTPAIITALKKAAEMSHYKVEMVQ